MQDICFVRITNNTAVLSKYGHCANLLNDNCRYLWPPYSNKAIRSVILTIPLSEPPYDTSQGILVLFLFFWYRMVQYFKNNIQSLNLTCSHHWNAMEPVADRLTPFITNYQIKPKISAISVRLKQKLKCKFKLNNALIIPNAMHVKTLHYSVPFIVFVLNLTVSTEFSHIYTVADKPKQNSLKCAFLPFVLQPPPWIFALSIRKIHRPGFPTLVFLGMSITWWV